MIEKIKTGGNGEKSKKLNECSDRGDDDGVRRQRRRAGGEALRFAYDQQLNTGYSVAYDLFAKLAI